ncbi:hypothetical protein [Streptomyces sp. NPDC048392]|uniref:hypothetical protein n=1 Tax=Streptomyces sp. NPDC048392 TaxID=3365543 RepID=UPI003710DCFA
MTGRVPGRASGMSGPEDRLASPRLAAPHDAESARECAELAESAECAESAEL